MSDDRRFLQLRLSPEMRQELEQAALKLGLTSADVARGALNFGLPTFMAMADIQGEVIRRMVESLKSRARDVRVK